MLLNLKRVAAIGIGVILLGAAPAHAANTLNVKYFTVLPSDPSYNKMCCDTVSDEVLFDLGPNGLPVFNTANSLNPSHYPAAADIDPITGELLWWTPSTNVVAAGSGTVSLPFDFSSNFYPPTGNTSGNDSNGGLSAHFYGTLNAPNAETIQFAIGADDSAFLFLDGKKMCDLGGVHGFGMGSCLSAQPITAGAHKFDLFFVDMNTVQSGLYVGIDTKDITISAAPEPAVWAMLLIGFGLIGMAMRRRTALGAA